MPLLKLYFVPTLVLLVLSWSQVSRAVPVLRKGPVTDSCVSYAHTLLQNITQTLTQNNLFSGIDCTKQSVELHTATNTPSVCAPKESTCSGVAKSKFDQDLCLTSIGEDLHHYYSFLAAQPDPDRSLAPTVLSLRELMENCFMWTLPTKLAAKEERPSTYDERLSLCKVLQGFQLRSITINRALSFMNSGDHTNEP